MANRSGRGLMVAGAILIVVGLAIVLIKVFELPEYAVPLMVGLGLFLIGAVRWLTSSKGR